MICLQVRQNMCGILIASLYLFIFLFTPVVNGEHRPDNLEDMEPMVWYDLKHRGPYLMDLVCDPNVPGRMFSGYGSLYESRDYGSTWNLLTEETDGQDLSFTFLSNGSVRIYSLPGAELKIGYSNDLGTSWSYAIPDQDFFAFSVSPYSGSIVAAEEIDSENKLAFWISQDCGQNWTKTTEFDQNSWTEDRVYFYHSPYQSGLLIALNVKSGESSDVRISNDDGMTWEQIVLPDSRWGFRWVSFHPTNPQELYFIFDKAQWWQFPIRRTRDGGNTWEEFGPDCSDAKRMGEAVLVDPTNPNYFAFSNHRRSGYLNVDYGAIYQTTDGGTTWQTVLIDSAEQGSITWIHESIAWNSPWDQKLYIRLGHLYCSENGGQSWLPVYPSPANYYNDYSYMGGYIDEQLEFMLYSQTFCGLFYSHNGGIDWAPAQINIECYDGFYIRDFCVDPNDNARVYFSCGPMAESGHDVYLSEDKGVSWQKVPYSGPGKLLGINTSSTVSKRLFGFYGTDSDIDGTVISHNDGITWESTNSFQPAGRGNYIDSRWDSNKLLSTEFLFNTTTELYEAWFITSEDCGSSWTKKSLIHTKAEQIPGAYQLTIYEDTINSSRIYFSQSNKGLFRSEDSGESWTCIYESHHYRGVNAVKTYGDDIIFWGKDWSMNGGETWNDGGTLPGPNYSMPGHFVQCDDEYYLYHDRYSRVIRIEANHPTILMAGFGTTWVTQGTPGNLDILVWATDPGQNDRVTSIEVLWDGEPIGYKIDQEIVDESGLFWISIPYDQLNDNLSGLEFRAKDIWGHLSEPSRFSTLF